MSELQNNDVSEMGAKAVALWKQGDKGDAIATFALWIAHHTITFQATVKGDKKTPDEVITFDLNEANRHSPAYRDIHNDNGSRNIKHINARTLEIAKRVFGLTDPTVAQKQRIDRALELVAGFERCALSLEAITLSNRNELVVPYVLMNAAPNPDKASTNEINAYERLRDSMTALDGKNGQSLAALKRHMTPPKPKGANDDRSDKGVAYVASLVMLKTVLRARNDASCENPAADNIPAFTGAIRQHHWDILVELQKLFRDDPMESDQEVPFAEAG